MKKPILILSLLLIISFILPVSAETKNKVIIDSNTGNNTSGTSGDISSNVSITNNSNGSSDNSTDSNTNINIEHSGEGNSRSEVNIDGKTYTLEDPGSINIENENKVKETTPALSPSPTNSESVLGESISENHNSKNSILNTLLRLLSVFLKSLFR
ncbi:hypothetical protein JXA63_01370 [Candidatus Woesebacteria bacterium]|nr:hypothetical protein [Candidatus Woesebacteria bacterium]